MPPRIPLSTSSWRPLTGSFSSTLSSNLSSTLCSSSSSSSLTAASCSTIPSIPNPRHGNHAQRFPGDARSFSASVPASGRVQLQQMRLWLKRNEPSFKNGTGTAEDPKPSYLTHYPNRPFPHNRHFFSMPVLSEKARELIWEKVMVRGEPVKSVSAELGVDIRRIAAVVRLKEVEKDWIAKKKPLARPYAKAFMAMLPQTDYNADDMQNSHEPFNEVVVHPYTLQQLFLPTSESRPFTRKDAAKAFHRGLLSTDKRIPHPELVAMERAINVEGVAPLEAAREFRAAAKESERLVAERVAKEALEEALATRKVFNDRGIEFRFRDYNVDDVGHKGRSLKGVGVRYGVASYDRKKGDVRIPTKVE